ncbi:MAG: hypothetical protein ABI634_12485 [Acidobacteriota bacterium]
MLKSFVLTLVFLCVASGVSAQTKGRVGVGASVTHNSTTDPDVQSATGVGILIRLNPHKGWGPAGAFNWFTASLADPAGGEPVARLRVRPLMGGVAYTIGPKVFLVSLSVVTGPSFNRVRFRGSRSSDPSESIEADNSWAFRLGVGVTATVAPRVAVVGFAGYLVNRPGVVYRDRFGTTFTGRWKADAVVTSVGVVYSVF